MYAIKTSYEGIIFVFSGTIIFVKSIYNNDIILIDAVIDNKRHILKVIIEQNWYESWLSTSFFVYSSAFNMSMKYNLTSYCLIVLI